MASLLITLFAIALVAAMLTGGYFYLNADAGVRSTIAMEASSGMAVLASGYQSYRLSNNSAPTSLSAITPSYAAPPSPPTGLSWSYGQDSNGDWFCLSGSTTEAVYDGLVNATRRISDTAAFVGSSCGATVNGAKPGSFPATAALTYWVRR